ncbi:hypothetical protein VAE308_1050573 [Vibrio aestuarianus]|uniref:Uncharacterized protein n=1 Tax=Vibrio aestuarianus TaxID=28171 RepID=A0ABN8TRT9_9VIBR|nr:hypothetical protein VAE308_1050573 [Vibrio aestuarianus]CAH8230089.1 hypothetical protein VAE063_940576 [Vibrio aestuarianus]
MMTTAEKLLINQYQWVLLMKYYPVLIKPELSSGFIVFSILQHYVSSKLVSLSTDRLH